MTDPAPRPLSAAIVRKIVLSLAAGSFVLAISSLTRQDLIQGVLLSVLVGGIVLLIQFLSDFDRSIEMLVSSQAAAIQSLTESQKAGFELLRSAQEKNLADFSKATQSYSRVQESPLDLARVQFLLEQAGKVGPNTSPLLLGLANLEMSRLGLFLKQVHDADTLADTARAGAEPPFSIAYHGEDREWLLGLASVATKSIDAISLSTIDAGVSNYDGGLWRSDLGHRYLEEQRGALRRDVQIRRLFYFDRPEISQDAVFQGICERQRGIGIQVRILEESALPPNLRDLVSDFIVFDDTLGYEMSSAVALADGHRPERLTTYLSLRPERLQDLRSRFDKLWQLARVPRWNEGPGPDATTEAGPVEET